MSGWEKDKTDVDEFKIGDRVEICKTYIDYGFWEKPTEPELQGNRIDLKRMFGRISGVHKHYYHIELDIPFYIPIWEDVEDEDDEDNIIERFIGYELRTIVYWIPNHYVQKYVDKELKYIEDNGYSNLFI